MANSFPVKAPVRHLSVILSAAAALCVSVGATARADDNDDRRRFLGDADIQSEVIGQNFAGHYRDGKGWTENYDAAGTLRYREPSIDIDGHWTLESGVFCTLYSRLLGGGCWRVLKVSRNCYEFYGTARGPATGRADQAWTARGWKTTEAPTCGAPQIS